MPNKVIITKIKDRNHKGLRPVYTVSLKEEQPNRVWKTKRGTTAIAENRTNGLLMIELLESLS